MKKITQEQLAEIAGVKVWVVRRNVHLFKKMLGLVDTVWANE